MVPTFFKNRVPMLVVSMTNTFNARVITIKNVLEHTFINLMSTLLKTVCAPLKTVCALLKTGCTALICWSDLFTCLFNKSYLMLLKNIFLLVGGLGLPGFAGLGCTAKFSKQTNKQSNKQTNNQTNKQDYF